ncbi:MAG: hypothetical protein BZY80_05250 [SAR202 cluster bacterium Io17-Chloro-G2]|nr:MAG: hypothetical protein BZY80_05250 [SAR202 cluster bacterium Io17-Chloro-G2]
MANRRNFPRQSPASLSESFTRFAELECQGMSDLYYRLSLGIAADNDLLELAIQAKSGQPRPNLFFAAVQRLLMDEPDHPLAAFYPHISGGSAPHGGPLPEDPAPAFRVFCLERQQALTGLLANRMVQTNVVRRCARILPAFAYVNRLGLGGTLFLIEIGASAGLNMLLDRYGYDYGEGRVYGNRLSPVQISSTFRGSQRPVIPGAIPDLADRIGVDLNPVELNDPEETQWLKALVWPERRDELGLLEAALKVASEHPPRVVKGDALDLLPGLIDAVPGDQVPCLIHSHVLNQFPREARVMFWSLVENRGVNRNLAVISMEGVREGEHAAEEVTYFRDGARTNLRLANSDSHGYWVEWLVE